MSENNKIISNPSFLQIGFCIFGMLFSSSITYFVYDSEWVLNDKSDNIMMWAIVATFSLLTIACFYLLFCTKKIELTNDSLTIIYPLVFHSKKIEFDDIKKVSESNYNVKSSHDFRTIEVYNGRKITIEMFESNKIIITSFEVTNYELLAKNLKNITTSYFKLNTEGKKMKSTQGYGWLIFIIILTFGLIISIIQKK